MTAITREASAPRVQPIAGLRAIARGRTDEPGWVRPAFVGVLALTALLYVVNLTVSGYANTYYSAAALAASKSWSAFFFGSFDAANFITVDKPPVAIWVTGLSVKLFGLSHWSVLLPQAIAGVLTVALLFVAVRRSFGPAAALIAAIVMALTPAAVLIFRFNNPDAVLTLLLVASALALLRALDSGSYRWTALAGTLVGFAFLTKYLQAYLVLPGFALVYAFAVNASLRRRIGGLVVAVISVLVASGWWVAIVQLLPAGSRPFIGGSTSGSVLDLIFGYDGLGRIFGGSGDPTGNSGAGAGFGGATGLLRMFNSQFFGEIAWFIPLAAVSLVLGLWLRRHVDRTDRGLAGYLLWGSWFVVHMVVFSYMSGIVHSYYAVALAPAVAALVAAGLVDLWTVRARHWLGALGLAAAFIGTAWLGMVLLDRTPTFAPGLGAVAVALAAVAGAGLLVAASGRLGPRLGRLGLVAAGLGLCATLLAPASYALATTSTALSGGDPHPGPGATSGIGGGPGGSGGTAPSGLAGGPAGGFGGTPPGFSAGSAPSAGAGSSSLGRVANGGTNADTTLVSYLVANKGSATWIVAVSGSQEAGSIEIASGEPVMAMGGFNGSDPTPTLAQLQAYIKAGKLRYVIAGGSGFGGAGGSSSTASSVSSWVTSSCTVVNYGGSSSSLYDCAGAVS